MTTFTTKDRKPVELEVKAFKSTDSRSDDHRDTESKNQPIVQYRIDDSSEDLDDWPA